LVIKDGISSKIIEKAILDQNIKVFNISGLDFNKYIYQNLSKLNLNFKNYLVKNSNYFLIFLLKSGVKGK
jgi:hypothetical protein